MAVVYSETFAGQDDNCSANYTITRKWSVTDCAGNNSEHIQVVTVIDETKPTFNGSLPADVTVECDEVPAPVVLTASDNCDNNVAVVYSETFAGQDDNCSANYTITRKWSVTDCAGNNSEHIQVVTVIDETKPTFNGSLPADVTVECDEVPAPVVLTASDNCDSNVAVVYSETFAGQDDNCSANYTITRKWSVTDCAGNNSEHIQVVTVIDETKPTFNGSLPADVTVECDEVPAPVVLTASDNCDSNVAVVYSETFAGQDDNCSANYTITRKWSVTDCAGNNSEHIQVVTVIDETKPTFNGSLPADVTVECDEVPAPVVLTASDNCDNNVIVNYIENKIVETESCKSNYTLERIWTATDCAGNTSVWKQIIKVQDTTPPTLPSPIAEVINVKCNEIPAKPELTFEDNCSSNIEVVYTESAPQNQNEYGYVIIRQWVATDECGNSTTIKQTINVSINAFSYVYGSVCNNEEPIDLFSFLEANVETNGTWLDVNNTGGLNGSFLNPKGINPGFYVYRYTISDGACPRVIEVYMTIDDDCIVLPCTVNDLKISKVVTPGDDGYNDTFKIGGLESCGFTFDVKVFNRWGALVYENKNYQNDWSGIAKGGISSSNLPSGTYYYIVNIVNSGFDILNGYFYLGTKN